MLMALMSSEEVQYEMLTTLGRIEANTKNTLETQNKIVLALIAIIGAIVGVEFLPQSPVDWGYAFTHSLEFLGVTGGLYTVLGQIQKRRKNRNV